MYLEEVVSEFLVRKERESRKREEVKLESRDDASKRKTKLDSLRSPSAAFASRGKEVGTPPPSERDPRRLRRLC